jgi:hypothetical protein
MGGDPERRSRPWGDSTTSDLPGSVKFVPPGLRHGTPSKASTPRTGQPRPNLALLDRDSVRRLDLARHCRKVSPSRPDGTARTVAATLDHGVARILRVQPLVRPDRDARFGEGRPALRRRSTVVPSVSGPASDGAAGLARYERLELLGLGGDEDHEVDDAAADGEEDEEGDVVTPPERRLGHGKAVRGQGSPRKRLMGCAEECAGR